MPRRNKTLGVIEQPTTIICVEWLDASSQAGPIGRAELSGAFRLVTVGLLIQETAERISICMDYVPEADEFRDVQHILKRNIPKRREYRR